MNWYGSGFIQIIIYSSQKHGEEVSTDILTETGEIILTEDGFPLKTE